MGRNGAGKSTLLSALVGLRRPDAGSVTVAGADPAALRGRATWSRRVGMVPQEPGDLLYADHGRPRSAPRPTGTRASRRAPRWTSSSGLVGGADPERHPRDLSEGQRLALALAVVLAGRPPVVLLDEPTRGLDYPGKEALVRVAARPRGRPGTPSSSPPTTSSSRPTVTDRTVVLADGEVVSDGPSREVVVSSPAFAPQVAKVLAPLPLADRRRGRRVAAGRR